MSRLQQLADQQFQQAFGTPAAANDPAAAQRKSAFQPVLQGMGVYSQQLTGMEQNEIDGALNRMGLTLGGGATPSRASALFGTDPNTTFRFQTENQYTRYIQGIRPLQDKQQLLKAELARLGALDQRFLAQEGALGQRVRESIGNFINAFDKEDASRGRLNGVMDLLNKSTQQIHSMAAGGVLRGLANNPEQVTEFMGNEGILPIDTFIARKKSQGLKGYDLQVVVKQELDRRRRIYRNPDSALDVLSDATGDLVERATSPGFMGAIRGAYDWIENEVGALWVDPTTVISAWLAPNPINAARRKALREQVDATAADIEASDAATYDMTIDTRAVVDALAYNAAAGFSDVAGKRDGGQFQRDTYDALTSIFDLAATGSSPDATLNAFFVKMAEIEQRSGIDINEVHAGIQTMYDFARDSAFTLGNMQAQQDKLLQETFGGRSLGDLPENEREKFDHLMELVEDQANMYRQVEATLADARTFLESTGTKHRQWSQANESGEGVTFQSTTISTPEMQKRSAQALLDGVLSAAAENRNLDPNGLPAELNDALAQLPEEQVEVFMDYLSGTDRLRDQRREAEKVTGDIGDLLEYDLPRAIQDFEVSDAAQRGRENVLFAQDRSDDEALLAEIARAGT